MNITKEEAAILLRWYEKYSDTYPGEYPEEDEPLAAKIMQFYAKR